MFTGDDDHEGNPNDDGDDDDPGGVPQDISIVVHSGKAV